MIDNTHTKTIESAQRQAFLDLLSSLVTQLADFRDLFVAECTYDLENQYGINIVCEGEREIISTPILSIVFDFAIKHRFSFYVDVDRNNMPRLFLYINKTSVL